jgi:hypothetical protein
MARVPASRAAAGQADIAAALLGALGQGLDGKAGFAAGEATADAAAAQRARRAAALAPLKLPVPDKDDIARIRRAVDARLQSLDTQRYSWWSHWAELARYILPRRYRYLITPGQFSRGSPINSSIIDSTGTVAARTLANGMMSGITSPSRPWFRLTVPDQEVAQDEEVKLWLDETMRRMQRVLAGSNYYTAKATQYHDLVVFGTAPMIIYDDPQTTIRCYNPCAGEYYCAEGARFSVDTLYRKFTMTVGQLVEEFGLEACSETVQNLWRGAGADGAGGASRDHEIVVCHAIEPNPAYVEAAGVARPGVELGGPDAPEPAGFKFREIYWEQGSRHDSCLELRGYADQPFSCPRWDVSGNDAYGRSPAMDALGDIKQLQVETKRKAQAIDKYVNPPMLADVGMKNEPASLLPGAVTYVPQINNGVGFRPVFQVAPPIGELREDIREVQARIMKVFFNDLFMMMAQLDLEAPNAQRTATEINARREEQLIQLGPVLERNETEGLGPDIQRIYRIMADRGMLPAMPQVLAADPAIKIEYVSMLAEAQRAAATTAIEQLWRFAGGMMGVAPQIIDNLNPDESIVEYADFLRVSPKLLNSPQIVQQQRAQRAQQQAQAEQAQAAQAALQGGQAMVDGAHTLSQTEIGGGQNALQAMLQGLQGGAGGDAGGAVPPELMAALQDGAAEQGVPQ